MDIYIGDNKIGSIQDADTLRKIINKAVICLDDELDRKEFEYFKINTQTSTSAREDEELESLKKQIEANKKMQGWAIPLADNIRALCNSDDYVEG